MVERIALYGKLFQLTDPGINQRKIKKFAMKIVIMKLQIRWVWPFQNTGRWSVTRATMRRFSLLA
jgi:hypothetical protein